MIGGQLVEAFGTVATFRICATFSAVSLVLYVTFHYAFLRKRIAAYEAEKKEEGLYRLNLRSSIPLFGTKDIYVCIIRSACGSMNKC